MYIQTHCFSAINLLSENGKNEGRREPACLRDEARPGPASRPGAEWAEGVSSRSGRANPPGSGRDRPVGGSDARPTVGSEGRCSRSLGVGGSGGRGSAADGGSESEACVTFSLGPGVFPLGKAPPRSTPAPCAGRTPAASLLGLVLHPSAPVL